MHNFNENMQLEPKLRDVKKLSVKRPNQNHANLFSLGSEKK